MLGSRSAFTRARILDAAERLFALKGHEATSLREITAEAQVNLASVHYHFGSKDGLVQAVCIQLIDALNRERIALLESCENSAPPDTPVHMAHVLDAYFRPLIHYASRHSVIREAFLPGRAADSSRKLCQQMLLDPGTEVAKRFNVALNVVMPTLPMREIVWRLQVLMVAICSTLHHVDGLYLALRAFDQSLDEHNTLQRVQEFMIVGVQGVFCDQWPGYPMPPPEPSVSAAVSVPVPPRGHSVPTAGSKPGEAASG